MGDQGAERRSAYKRVAQENPLDTEELGSLMVGMDVGLDECELMERKIKALKTELGEGVDRDRGKEKESLQHLGLPPTYLDDAQIKARLERRKSVKRVRTKCEAILWVSATVWMIRYTDMYHVVFESDEVDRLWLNFGLIAFFCNLCIFVYLALWLPWKHNIHDNWEKHRPRIIPTAALIALFSFLCFVIALWPHFHVMSPVVLFVLLMGTIMSLHFMPSCIAGKPSAD